jgi:H+/Cl- antiporter ClcA
VVVVAGMLINASWDGEMRGGIDTTKRSTACHVFIPLLIAPFQGPPFNDGVVGEEPNSKPSNSSRLSSLRLGGLARRRDSFFDFVRKGDSKSSMGWKRRMPSALAVKFICLLGLLGVCAGIMSLTIEEAVQGLRLANEKLIGGFDKRTPGGFFTWWAFTVACTLASVFFVRNVSPLAAGSGIPEMKCILAGTDLSGYLTSWTLVGKVVGLMLSRGSGLIIGEEGPLVHITACIGTLLMKCHPIFQPIFNNQAMRNSVWHSACAVGVAATFRAPIGGVLFSIEVTNTYYLLSNYSKAFFSAILSSFVGLVFINIDNIGSGLSKTNAIFQTFYDPGTVTYSFFEFPIFILFSLFLGVLAGGMANSVRVIVDLNRRILTSFNRKIMSTVAIATLTAILLYLPGEWSRNSLRENVQILLSQEPLPEYFLTGAAKYLILLSYGLTAMLLVTFSQTLAVPAGSFLPMFGAGAAFGRALGELVNDNVTFTNMPPGGYALVGAAALSGGYTQTISACVIAFEVTGQLHYIIPVVLGTVIAVGTAELFADSIYDTILIARKLPHIGHVKFENLQLKAGDIMLTNFHSLTRKCSYQDIISCLNRTCNDGNSVPILNGSVERVFLGSASRLSLAKVPL